MDFLADLLVASGSRVFALVVMLLGAAVLLNGGIPWVGASLLAAGMLTLVLSLRSRKSRGRGPAA